MAKTNGGKDKPDKPQAKLTVMESIPLMNADDILTAIMARMAELKPSVDEYYELEQAEQALSKIK
jgi:hypothetical protein